MHTELAEIVCSCALHANCRA